MLSSSVVQDGHFAQKLSLHLQKWNLYKRKQLTLGTAVKRLFTVSVQTHLMAAIPNMVYIYGMNITNRPLSKD
jgi:hypothetical protein